MLTGKAVSMYRITLTMRQKNEIRYRQISCQEVQKLGDIPRWSPDEQNLARYGQQKVIRLRQSSEGYDSNNEILTRIANAATVIVCINDWDFNMETDDTNNMHTRVIRVNLRSRFCKITHIDYKSFALKIQEESWVHSGSMAEDSSAIRAEETSLT